uniref:Aminopeptidase n=1 Tax=Panagrellus redivivus TaxID=6233 RepID=A0A7E4VMQ7_PANRE
MVPPAMEDPDPVKATISDHPVKYKMKLRRCLLFYLIVPAIPVFLLVIGFLYLMDTPPVIPTSLPSIQSVAQQQPPDDLIERLPHDLKPSLYIITMQTFLPYKQGVDFGHRNRTVDAYVLMNFLCRKQTNKIILNAYDLIIDENKLRLHDQDTKESLAVRLAEIRNETQVLEFVTEQPMLVGHNYSMKINYGTRMLEPGNRGLFLASYQTGNETRYHMVSQMQPIFARRVFPCFDEPEFKAEFQIVVIHPQGTTAVSNTKLQSMKTLRDKNWLRSEFHPTPKMSTYLLAVAVTDFPFIETYYRDIRIRVYAQPNHINYTYHVLNTLPKALKYYEHYFNILYPLQKLDVYVVQELTVTAMENWGLITAKDDAVVFHEETSTIHEKSFAEMTVFHEVAHMWFGNLITMRWWNDLWLNEGFAVHMSTAAGKNLTVEIDSLESLGDFQELHTMTSEETLTKQPLSSKIVRRSGVTSAFEPITYHKGAAVLRQLKTIVGEHQFQRVLRDFILEHIYDNADSEDFIKSIIKSLGKSNPFGEHDVSASIKTWTHNKGFPLITVTRLNSTSIQLSQRCYSKTIQNQAPPNHTWTIPLFFKHDFEQKESDVAMLHGNDTLILHNVAVLDPEHIGYYKILYDTQTFDGITRQLYKNHTVISARARAKLITCFFQHSPCIEYVRNQLSKLKITCATKKLSDSCNSITPGCRDAVYAMTLRHGTADDFDFLWNKLMIETVPMERAHISLGLSGTTNETLSIKTFDYHSFHNITSAIKNYCASFYNFYTLEVIRPHVTKVFKKLIERHGNSRFVKTCSNVPAKVLINDKNVKQFDDFIANSKDMPLYVRAWTKFSESNHLLLALQKQHAPLLAQYLDEFNKRYQNVTDYHDRLFYNPGIVD